MDGQNPISPTPPASGGGAGKLIGGIIVLIVILGAGYYFLRSKPTEEPAAPQTQGTPPPANQPSDNPTTPPPVDAMVKAFSVVGTEFKFSLPEIRVKAGEKVKINFTNSGSMNHDWRVDQFNAATKVLTPGQSDSIEFTASTKGTFEYYCSVGQHRQAGMKGNLVVE